MDNIILMPGQFLSTLSLRRATYQQAAYFFLADDFYPRSPCGERQISGIQRKRTSDFYPRSPCGERQTVPGGGHITETHFYPRSPCGERRDPGANNQPVQQISIHALLAESDVMHSLELAGPMLFLSTLSLRRATAKVHKTVGHFCAYETNFMGIASSC